MALPNPANILSKGALFPTELVPEFFNKVQGKSSLAKLSGQKPIPFNGMTEFTFNMDNEVDIVAENGAKSAGGASVGQITIVPIKIEYGARVSDEFRYASEEVRLEYLRAFSEGWAAKVARGIDIMAMHGVNPRTGLAATGTVGNNHLDYAADSLAYDDTDIEGLVETAIQTIMAAGHNVTGLAGGSTIRTALAAQKNTLGAKVFPELAWGGQPGSLHGLPVDFNPTVEFNGSDARAYVGDFANCFRWGIAKQLPIEVIEYGNPDNDQVAGDLKGHNQVYLRGEAYIGWGIMDPTAFVVLSDE